MKPSALMLALKSRLDAWVAEGVPNPWSDPPPARPRLSIEIARDIQHALGLLCDATSRPIVVLAWGGEDELDDHLAAQRIDVFIGWNPGISSRGHEAALPMTDIVRDVKNVCLGLHVAGDGTNTDALGYGGASPVNLPDGFPLAAFRIALTLDDDGGEIVFE